MSNNGFDHFKYSVHIRFIRNTKNPYSVYKKPNPNTANPYSAYKKTNPNSFISYSVYKKRNYSVPYIFGFGRIIRIRLTPKIGLRGVPNFLDHLIFVSKPCIPNLRPLEKFVVGGGLKGNFSVKL